MSSDLNRRTFIKQSIATSSSGLLALQAGAQGNVAGKAAKSELPMGKIGDMQVSRLLLGGNLLTHFTHSRDLKYVYNLTAHYNTNEKIVETMRIAETHGINTLVVHTVPNVMNVLKEYRYKLGGKMQWIICPTAPVDDQMTEYSAQVREIADMGVDAVYVWGVRADQLVSQGRVDLIAKAVDAVRQYGIPSGIGAHDLKVITECEKNMVDADFYIKTLHHHNYPSAPKPHELTQVHTEVPGYWCRDPKAVVDCMKTVKKPWIAFKVMAAGAIPPTDAFRYAFESGADHVLAGMFDFEIAEDAQITRTVLSGINRTRPWRS